MNTPGSETSGSASHEMKFNRAHQQELEAMLQQRPQEERRPLRERADIVQYTPPFPRLDESTPNSTEPAIPLLFIRGLGKSSTDEQHLEALAREDGR